MRKQIAIIPAVVLACLAAAGAVAEESWSIGSSSEWKQATASMEKVVLKDGRLMLDAARQGQWTSKWHEWEGVVQSAKITVETDIDLFDNKTIKILVNGSATPYTDADGTPHDWYGRCMIAIIDGKRWIMALRSGLGHINWGGRDTSLPRQTKEEPGTVSTDGLMAHRSRECPMRMDTPIASRVCSKCPMEI